MWYKFYAYNTETRYGWTRDINVAQAVLDCLNRNREINLYDMVSLSDSENESDGREIKLTDLTDLICDDDSQVYDFQQEQGV
jgi:hypothetical protein